MKKLVSAVLALTLTLGMGLTAMAAPSPEKGNGVTNAATSEAGVTVEVEKIANEAVVVEAAEKEAVAQASAETKVTVLASAEVTASRTVTKENPLTVTFNVPTVQAGWTVYALHQKADGTWEKLATVVANGTVTVTFTSLSPVVFVREESVAAASAQPIYSPEWYEQQKAQYAGSNAAATAATTAGITSPKTGE